ncbi:gamma-glutamyltranspeptidase / glutathione hydrolase [Nakamurella panacisegetis]|uniref:Gamma-glutamyltranspeptidase / glutathione hydrolase n=1 Tax=Nakamurella panacisegetis TaxID=1090615 RepID=A0A1H0SIM7_9ACTN|nr:gamma-glutamyltransferase [Nakamurella panacisegetis]SDP41577.1 gamma-glutamyltranspeptidase / glutathione hydrolase [Nakamurella panacisegetis]
MNRLPAGVAAGHPATAAAGLDVLAAGGSAADSAAAMILAGCVAETIFCGLGGGGFATVYEAATGTVTCLDFFVTVPGLDGTVAGPAQEISVSFGGVAVPYAMGGPTVAVPGTPAGVAALHSRFGRLSWAEIVGPAQKLAASGVEFSTAHADLLPDVAPAMMADQGIESYSRVDIAGARRLLQAGQRLYHPGLAETLAALAEQGPDVVTTGELGRAMVDAVRADGGALSVLDMAAYRVLDLVPTRVPFGPGILQVRSNDLDSFARSSASLDRDAVARGGVDRARALVAALRAPARRTETTSVVAVDSVGNACAATHSLGLGSGIWVGGVHGNSMLGEGELLRGELLPGARMPSMMVPSVVTGPDGDLLFAGGAAGGSRIRPALLQVMAGVLVQGRGVAEAVAAPRLSVTPEVVHLEPGFPPEVIAGLRAAGEELVLWDAPRPYFGGVAAAAADGPAADPRRGGAALALG